MPVSVSMVCESTTANVTAALRESLANSNGNNNNGSCSSATAATGNAADDCGISTSAALMSNGSNNNCNTNGTDADDDCLQNKLIASAKAVLLSKIDYIEVDNYGQSVLETLKSKYIVLKPLTNSATNGSNCNTLTTTENGRNSPAATCNNGNNNNTTNTSTAKNNGQNHSSIGGVASASNVVSNGVGSSSAADCNGNENVSSAGSRITATLTTTTTTTTSSSSSITSSIITNVTATNIAATNNAAAAATTPRRSPLSHELPQPKRILFPRENVRVGWKNGTRKWQIGVGMMNVGNTCYLNSVLQALFHVPSMAHYLVSESQHMDRCEGGDAGCIICAMCKTLLQSQTHTSPIRPYFVYTRLRTICKHLVMGRQEDAHEFLRYLVEAMEKSFLSRFRNPKELDQYSKETTPMNQILGGYLRSAVRCLSCGHVSVTFQHFQDLLLDIRKADTLEEALEGYFARERLEDMGYKCEACKKKVSATKQFTLERAPIALCIQLKRFSMIGSKLNKQITIRLRLDLSRYLTRKNSNESCSYKLVSMITHLGASQHCGHYTAIGLTESGAYYHFDDSYVRPISAQNVCNTNAYVIFYELDNAPPTSTTTQRTATITSTQLSGAHIKETNNNSYQTKTNGFPLSVKSTNTNNNTDNITNGPSQRMIGPQLPPGGLQNYNGGGIKLKNVISNCSSSSATNNKSNNSTNNANSTNVTNPNPKIQIHFKNSPTTSTTSIRSTNATTTTISNVLNSKNNTTTAHLNGNAGTPTASKSNNINGIVRQFSIINESSCDLEPPEDGISSTTDGYTDCNMASSSFSSLPSMPNLGEDEDKSKQRTTISPATISINNNINNNNKNNSLVPYDLESDDDNTGNTVIRRQDSQSPASVKSERSEKLFVKSLKRSSSFSQLENGNLRDVFVADSNFNTSNGNKSRKLANGSHHNNSLNITNDSLNQQSKTKHKTDLNPIDVIFNSSPKVNSNNNNSNANIINDISKNSINARKSQSQSPQPVASNSKKYYDDNDEDAADADTPPNTPIKREKQHQNSAPDSPPIIQTKTGFWKVSDINADETIENNVASSSSKLLNTPPKTWINPFSSKVANTEKTNSQRQPATERRAQFAGNGYKTGSKIDLNTNGHNDGNNGGTNPVSELLQQSHRGYGAPVLTWNGEQNDIEKEVKNEARDLRRQDIDDEDENEMDRGRQKKVKQANGSRNGFDSATYEQTPGFNPFQEHDNQRRWKQNGNNNHNYSSSNTNNSNGNSNSSSGNGNTNYRYFNNRLPYNQRNKFHNKRYNNPYNKYQRTPQQNSTTGSSSSNSTSNSNNNHLTNCNSYAGRRES